MAFIENNLEQFETGTLHFGGLKTRTFRTEFLLLNPPAEGIQNNSGN